MTIDEIRALVARAKQRKTSYDKLLVDGYVEPLAGEDIGYAFDLATACEELMQALELAGRTEARVLSGIPLIVAYEPEDYLNMVAEEAQARRDMSENEAEIDTSEANADSINFTSDPAKCKENAGSLHQEETK